MFIDRGLNKDLWKNYAENVHQKLAPDPFLIFINNPKQPLHERNSLKNFFLKVEYQKAFKKFIFSFEPSPFYWTKLSITKGVWI